MWLMTIHGSSAARHRLRPLPHTSAFLLGPSQHDIISFLWAGVPTKKECSEKLKISTLDVFNLKPQLGYP